MTYDPANQARHTLRLRNDLRRVERKADEAVQIRSDVDSLACSLRELCTSLNGLRSRVEAIESRLAK